MRSKLAIAAAAVALALIGPAIAAGPNGGQTTVADGHPVEFVASETEVTFFLTGEDGKPLDTANLNAKAFLSTGGKTLTLTLKPVAPNKLVGTIGTPLAKGTKVVLSTKAHGHTLQARFEN